MSVERTKSRKLFIVRQRPGPHPLTKQQARFKEAAEYCGIQKGITREELVVKMVECIPDYYRQLKKEREEPENPIPPSV